MKKFSFIFLAVCALFVSCSEKQETAAPVSGEDWLYDESKPVPVDFVVPSVGIKSKAAPNGPIDGVVMNTLDIGVIGVQPTSEDDVPGWTDGDDTTVLIDNVAVTTGEDGSITFSPKIYYPINLDTHYAFYGYYPYGEVEYTENGYTVSCEIGNTDILWAESKATEYEGLKGFNAEYIRKITNDSQEGYMPSLQFRHLLTALRFVAMSENGEVLDNVTVSGIEIKNTVASAKLCIVDRLKVTESASGTFTETQTGNVKLEDAEGNTSLAVNPTSEGAEVGTLLLMPSESYVVNVALSVEGGKDQWIYDIPVTREEGMFEAGKRYKMTVIVKSPVEVSIPTSLIGWEDMEEEVGGQVIG